MPDHEWPDYCPKDDCPPPDAAAAAGVVYRLALGTPPTMSDFLPLIIEQPDRDYRDKVCMACGLSVYRTLEDVRRLQARVAGHRNKPVAVGTLTGDLGLMKPTPVKGNSHYTWWLPVGVDPSSAFQDVNAGGSA